ncbi:hypothetical protein MGH68_12140 [Erysipelothrix sp. D19-032]
MILEVEYLDESIEIINIEKIRITEKIIEITSVRGIKKIIAFQDTNKIMLDSSVIFVGKKFLSMFF